ncbi:MAG: hypothetical protein II266_08460, partial [Clostridia bacterium]|nr:hypothetical protein [Clostridia bacterium]
MHTLGALTILHLVTPVMPLTIFKGLAELGSISIFAVVLQHEVYQLQYAVAFKVNIKPTQLDIS